MADGRLREFIPKWFKFFFLLEYSKFHVQMSMQCFIHVVVHFEKKISVLSISEFRFIALATNKSM